MTSAAPPCTIPRCTVVCLHLLWCFRWSRNSLRLPLILFVIRSDGLELFMKSVRPHARSVVARRGQRRGPGIRSGFALLMVLRSLAATEAQAGGRLKVASRLLDSESRGLWAPRPEVGLGLDVGQESWRGWLGVRLLPDAAPSPEQPYDDPERYVVALTRAEGWRQFGPVFLAGGRLEARPFELPLHYGNQSFLRGVARMDGVAVGYREAGLHLQLLAGSPLTAGFVAAFEPEFIKFLASYVYRHDAVIQVPLALDAARLAWSTRTFDAHEWELAAVSQGSLVAITAVFQGRHAGQMRFSDSANPRTADAPGDVDRKLPRTSGDYRALSQVAVLVNEPDAGDGALWLAFAVGGASAPRYHAGTSEELLRRQGSGSKFFAGLSLEEVWEGVRAQGGVTMDYAGEPVFLWLNQRDESGRLEKSRERLRGWLALSLDF